jgi:hypothetical protein
MLIKEIADWSEFMAELRDKDTGWWAFRGVCDANYQLLPSIGRATRQDKYSRAWELEIFERFKRQSLPFLATPPVDDFGWLAIGQHHGLPTRLLDWTRSPIIAAYFAAYAPPGADPRRPFAVYGYETTALKSRNITPAASPFNLPSDFVEVHVSHHVPRISAQQGFFTVQSDPCQPLKPPKLEKWIIDADERDDFLSKLDLFGTNHSSLFPGLDGIAMYWNWYYRNVGGEPVAAGTENLPRPRKGGR